MIVIDVLIAGAIGWSIGRRMDRRSKCVWKDNGCHAEAYRQSDDPTTRDLRCPQCRRRSVDLCLMPRVVLYTENYGDAYTARKP